MSGYFEKGEIFVWMPMLGFEKEDPDRGVARVRQKMPLTPQGMSVFLFHIDIVMQHTGMAQKRILPPDNCAYYGNPYNNERNRQEWSNHDVRELVHNLAAAGTAPYLGIMGSYLADAFHEEWLSLHQELRFVYRQGKGGLNILKRLKDGRYFEDIFLERLLQVLDDYGFAGIHATDGFANISIAICDGDYSLDMVEQFSSHTGISLPADLLTEDDDDLVKVGQRADWIWARHRVEWIRFYAWRRAAFWKKICTALHKVGKKVIALPMYCTDPFETLYCLGNDLRLLQDAGIDYYMPNYAATGLRTVHPELKQQTFRQMNMVSLTSVFAPKVKLLNMMGVRDVTEEWDLIHHLPCSLERDVYSLSGLKRKTATGYVDCLTGHMVCLGDGLNKNDWQWLAERFETGFFAGLAKSLAPLSVWSDQAFYNTLPAYIKTRRWTHHKLVYELEDQGGIMGAAVRVEDLQDDGHVLFIPDFDLFADEEKKRIASFKNSTILAVCASEAAGKSLGFFSSPPDLIYEDHKVEYGLCIFIYNSRATDLAARADKIISEDCGFIGDAFTGPASAVPEFGGSVLRETLKFTRVSKSFIRLVAFLVKSLGNGPFSCNLPMKASLLENGWHRLHIYNPSLTSYGYATVSSTRPFKQVKVVSSFQLLPVKFMDKEDSPTGFVAKESDGTQKHFRAKIAMDGATILEVLI